MMSNFSLHPQLVKDCYILGKLELCQVLLLNNAHFRWFILVPEVPEQQMHLLPEEQRVLLQKEIQFLSNAVEESFSPKRINIGAIGNMVPQMHIHVVAREESDPAWPGVVWGFDQSISYAPEGVEEIRKVLGF